MSLKLEGMVYASCSRSSMLYGNETRGRETWATNAEQLTRLKKSEIGVRSIVERKRDE